MAGLGVGLAVGLGSPSAGGGGGAVVNPNLLLWTEEFDNAAWTVTNGTVDATGLLSPFGDEEADQFTSSGALASLAQVSGTAAGSGLDTTAVLAITPAWVRYSVSGSFDAVTYTFSIYLKKIPGGGAALRLRLGRSGGFLRCAIEDDAGLGDFGVYGAQLEAAAVAGTYFHRTT